MDCGGYAALSCPGTAFSREAGRYWGKIRIHSPPCKHSVKTGACRTSGRESCLPFWLLSEDTHAHSRQTSQVSSNQKARSPATPKSTAGFLAMFSSPGAVGESSYLPLHGLNDPLENTWLSVFAAHRTGWMASDKSGKAFSSMSLGLHGRSC